MPRWLAYFDLLGMRDLIRRRQMAQVFDAYATATEKLSAWRKRHPKVFQTWFSDTFIVYTNNDSALSFRAIDAVTRWFVFSLIRSHVPVRGALACGAFYADARSRIYFGEALLEAYEWGENQDWIGYVLAPSAAARLDAVGLPPLQRLNYRAHDIPFKKPPEGGSESAVACLLGNWIQTSTGGNFLMRPLQQMYERQSDKRVRAKYERTIAFLKQYEGRGFLP